MTANVFLLAALFTVGGCIPGGPGPSNDPPAWMPDGGRPDSHAPDARTDVPVTCGSGGSGRLVSGELLDLKWTTTAASGVDGAILTERGGTTTDTTTPGGAFDLCVVPDDAYTFDVDAPGSFLDAVLVVDDRAFTAPNTPVSVRTATASVLSELYAAYGLALDLTKGQVLVLNVAMTWDMRLMGALHGTVLAGSPNGTSGLIEWRQDTAGRYVLFPNVLATSPTVTVQSAGAQTNIPIVPGKLTLVVLADYFCFKAPCI